MLIVRPESGEAIVQRARWGQRPHAFELDDGARLEVFDLTGGTLDGAVSHVDDEISLGEQAAIAGHPRLAQDLAAASEHILHERAADVAAVDMKRPDFGSLRQARNIDLKVGRRLLLGSIGGGNRAGENELGIEVGGDVTLVAIESLALALAPWRMSLSSTDCRRASRSAEF